MAAETVILRPNAEKWAKGRRVVIVPAPHPAEDSHA